MLAAVTTLRDDPGALLQRGVKLADAGDVDAAIAAHEAALAIDPSLAQAHANLIALYGRQRNFAKAEEHYRAVVALGVNVADAHYDYGVLLGLQERWDDAADAYRRALALNPLHARGAQQSRADSRAQHGSSTRPPPSTGARSRASRRCASRDSTWDACSSRWGARTRPSASCRS